ncbi:MAG: copper chaperone PCu(A)C [Dehalococcoidia bacterium]
MNGRVGHRAAVARSVLGMAAVVGLMLIAGCGDNSAGVIKGDLEISDAVARFPAPSGTGAVYLTIDNTGGADALLSAEAPVAARAQIHQVVTEGGSSRMQMLDRLDIPADGTLRLRPGSYHIMLMNVAEVPQTGDEFELTLEFENAGSVVVPVEVVDQAEVDERFAD